MTDEGPQIINLALCGLLGTPQETAEAISAVDASDICLHPNNELE
jgi:hypothetical protein